MHAPPFFYMRVLKTAFAARARTQQKEARSLLHERAQSQENQRDRVHEGGRIPSF